ncbi:PspC domain-containing protein [Candidatus Woesearchaeota archaeon]|nr:PspC domain-containing protein [Candidatus Woesearchaeota archaeon]
MLSSSSIDTQGLRRNPKRGRIAGLCSGLSESLGVDVFWLRLLVVLSVFVSFSTTFWIYLVLWMVVPKRPETPLPDVPFRLWWALRRIDRQVNRAHRKLPSALADEIQTVFDLIKLLAPRLDDSLSAVALERFPALLRQFMAMPRPVTPVSAGLHDRLQHELQKIEQTLKNALENSLGPDTGASGQPAGEAEWARWQATLQPLKIRLEGRVEPETWAQLGELEAQLAFLLNRTVVADQFDRAHLELGKIAHEYVPDALNQYLRLPADRARQQTLADGRTAEQALFDQLALLSARLRDQAHDAFEEEARELRVHGRFLHEKFAEPEAGRSILDDPATVSGESRFSSFNSD